MINRYIPYGYYIENAQIKVNEVEADVIREMFHRYIAGSSLKGLAEALTRAGIEYLPGKNAWDQNRVYRLLCSNKYAGENGFPPIVTADDYRRDEKGQGQKGPEYLMTITEAVAPILCGACGQPAVRHRGRAGKGRQRFVCGNPDCAAEYCITDEKMTELVLHLMRGAEIQTPEPRKTTLEIRKTENEIERLLEAPDADPKEIRCRIFDLAAEKYRLLTAGLAISHKTKKNDDRPMYYVENSHPAIVSRETFDRVQEELARRIGKRKVKQVGTKTENGKYSSKFALTEILVCGCCGSPYRRCTWAKNGKKRIVWRCISANTVKRHLQNIMEKTGYSSRLDLAMNARLLGLVVHEDSRTNRSPP